MLAPTLPALPAAALVERAPPVVEDTLPAPMSAPTEQGRLRASWALEGAPISLEVLEQTGVYTLVLKRRDPVSAPDPLVYWSSEAATTGLPPDARLLGPLTGAASQTFELPRPTGHILIYSLGHGEVCAQGSIPAGATP